MAELLSNALAKMKLMEAEIKSLKDDSEKPTLKRSTALTVASTDPQEALAKICFSIFFEKKPYNTYIKR